MIFALAIGNLVLRAWQMGLSWQNANGLEGRSRRREVLSRRGLFSVAQSGRIRCTIVTALAWRDVRSHDQRPALMLSF
jgi:hypothetical protein